MKHEIDTAGIPVRELKRMCNSSRCEDCEFYDEDKGRCGFIKKLTSARSIWQALLRWKEKNPQKTRREDLFEKIPSVHPDIVHLAPPYCFGYCKGCVNCYNNGKKSMTECWNEPAEGGETGEEV